MLGALFWPHHPIRVTGANINRTSFLPGPSVTALLSRSHICYVFMYKTMPAVAESSLQDQVTCWCCFCCCRMPACSACVRSTPWSAFLAAALFAVGLALWIAGAVKIQDYTYQVWGYLSPLRPSPSLNRPLEVQSYSLNAIIRVWSYLNPLTVMAAS